MTSEFMQWRQGGLGSVVDALVKAVEKHGGEVRTKVCVDEAWRLGVFFFTCCEGAAGGRTCCGRALFQRRAPSKGGSGMQCSHLGRGKALAKGSRLRGDETRLAGKQER